MARKLGVLLAAALALYSANALALALPALDDCFYARKGVEMARGGGFFTVTWNGRPTFQNPPLPFWFLARSFSLLGENDLAARLPSILMALGILLGVYRIGVRLGGPAHGLTAAALLSLSPYFVNNARRCMMEVPLTFWVVASVLALLEGRERRRWHVLLGAPLAAGILTKSLLGLLPLILLGSACLVSRQARGWLRSGALWAGILLGLALGSSWTVQQGIVHGADAVRAHYTGEILARATEARGLWAALTDYPLILLTSFEPLAPLALPGLWALWRRRRSGDEGAGLLVVLWAVVPVLLYSLSSARSPRYVFVIFPALALCAASWLVGALPRTADALATRIVPGLLIAAALVFWWAPQLLTRPGTAVFKARGDEIRGLVPAGEPLTYLGTRYWELANPLLYYAETPLDPPTPSPYAALAAARRRASRALLVDGDQRGQVPGSAGGGDVIVQGPTWAIVRVGADQDRAGRAQDGVRLP